MQIADRELPPLEIVSGDTAALRLSGSWLTAQGIPSAKEFGTRLAGQQGVRRLLIDGSELARWDSALLTFLLGVIAECSARGIVPDLSKLPNGARRLIGLATAVPERAGTRRGGGQSFLAAIGKWGIEEVKSFRLGASFIGELAIAFGNLLRGKARFRRSDLLLTIQECGAQALPIVTIISLLVGLIFAFVGAVQLRQFGAQIYVANLVAIAMAREMAAVMTGIVLAGRTGAAFAAQIGAMQGNEEVDALSTLGVPPMEFLVLPRMIALVLMTPLLCIYADLLGIIGGWIVGVGMLGITSTAYLLQTQGAASLGDFAIGIVKSGLFGILVAIAGCAKGIQCGRTAASVGNAATAAVVSGILYIIVADATITVILNAIGL